VPEPLGKLRYMCLLRSHVDVDGLANRWWSRSIDHIVPMSTFRQIVECWSRLIQIATTTIQQSERYNSAGFRTKRPNNHDQRLT